MDTFDKISYFHALHHQDDILFMPNVWDALSAKLCERAGAKAIATTSACMASIFGYPDGEHLPKSLLLAMVERIVKSVQIPVSVDLEAGYGNTTEALYNTVTSLIHLGIAGINIEDHDSRQPGQLFPLSTQLERLSVIQKAVKDTGSHIFVNARTDIYWLNLYDDTNRLHETKLRLGAYQLAGAHGLFVPGFTDIDRVTELLSHITIPLNLLAGSRVQDVSHLKSLGVARLTIGSAMIRDIASHMDVVMKRLLSEKNTGALLTTLDYHHFNALWS